MTYRLFLFLFSLVLLHSCVDVVGDEELKSIDKLQLELNDSKTMINSLPSDSIVMIDNWMIKIDSAVNSINFLVSNKLGNDILQIAVLKKNQKELKGLDQKLMSQIDNKLKNLETLKSDLKSGKGRRVKYKEYIESEIKIVSEINKSASIFINQYRKNLRIFNRLKGQIIPGIEGEKL